MSLQPAIPWPVALQQDVRVIELVGTLSFSNVDYVSRQLASRSRPQFVIFDLRRVTSLTRAGARLVAEEFRELAAHHVTVIYRQRRVRCGGREPAGA